MFKIKELRNSLDDRLYFEDLEKAKEYYMPNLNEFPECFEYAEEIQNAETLEELSNVLNKYTDVFDNGSRYYVREF